MSETGSGTHSKQWSSDAQNVSRTRPLGALALKELREIRGIALVALVIYALLVVGVINPTSSLNLLQYLPLYWAFRGGQETLLPFVNDTFVARFLVISAGLAIALGFFQSLGETVRGTYPFLLHRPVTRRWSIAVKLLVGMAAYWTCATIPLVIYGLWAATPGTHAGPFEWSMTWPTWAGLLSMTLLYFGAFLTGIRPGRWYASRLLPLVAAVFGAAFAAVAAWGPAQQAPLWVALAVLVADVWVISAIFFVARTRDFS